MNARAIDLNKRTDRLIVREHELDKRISDIDVEVDEKVALKVNNAIQQVIHRTIASNEEVQRGRSQSPPHKR